MSTDKPVTVILNLTTESAQMDEVVDLCKANLTVFASLDGFVSGVIHRVHDAAKIITVLQWRSVEDHLACMQNPIWADVPVSARFQELMESGVVSFTMDVADVIASADPEPDA